MEPYPTLPFYLPSLRVMYDDFHPLLESSCSLEDQYVLSLIRSVNQKLHLVDVHDCFGKTLWRDVFSQGLSCEVLNVRSLHFRKLNIVGEFAQLHILILDSNRVTGFGESCFSCMPNLTCLSMCDTVVSDLWTASAALLKLPSLEVLWFQIWICCSESSTDGGGGSSTAP
ncbi:BnaCnng37220D [Brassica napus]|uniref:BnaCnng37220D protein n=1 Tax=Brassica napus TaxID=3708 RepID=A0A078J7J0_BRANA|nr:BnaCnng37220D [Brassica napus]